MKETCRTKPYNRLLWKAATQVFRFFCCLFFVVQPLLGQSANLQTALLETSKDLGFNVVFRAEIPMGLITSCGARKGKADVVLTCLLKGTGLHFRNIGNRTFLIDRRLDPKISKNYDLPLFSIVGRIRESGSGRPLPQATVWLAENQQLLKLNEQATFRMEGLSGKQYSLHVRLLGFEPTVVQVQRPLSPIDSVHIWLRAINMEVLPVIIEGKQGQLLMSQNEVSEEARLAMRGLGTPDVLSSTSTLNGVYLNDARGEVHIQGGEAGEHLIRLDGMPIYEPLQLRGITSAFSPFAVGQMTLHKAGFGVEEGSALAGVMAFEHNLRMPENQKQYIESQIDQLSLNARWVFRNENQRGQIKAMATARLGLGKIYQPASLRGLLQNWSQPDEFLPFAAIVQRNPLFFETARSVKKPDLTAFKKTTTDFNDLHGAIRWDFGRGNTLQTSLYLGWNTLSGNNLTTDTTQQTMNRDTYRWGNGAVRLNWNRVSGKGVLRSLTAIGASYRLNHQYNYLANLRFTPILLPDGSVLELRDDPIPADDGNRYQEIWLQAKWSALRWAWGLDAVWAGNRVAFKQLTHQIVDISITQPRFSGYASFLQPLRPYGRVELGIRSTWLVHQGFYAEPRAVLRLLDRPFGGGRLAGFVAAGLYRQFVQQFEFSSFSPSALLPSMRFWIPISDQEPPLGRHVAARLDWKTNFGFELGGEVYQKALRHLRIIDYEQLWEWFTNKNKATQVDEITGFAKGKAAGLGLEAKWKNTALEAVVRYDYSLAMRTTQPEKNSENLALQIAKPAAWSEPNRFLASLKIQFSQNFKWTLNGRVSTGRTWAFRKAYYDYLVNANLEAVFGDFNLHEPEKHVLPMFMQWDTGFAFSQAMGKAKIQIRVECLNVLNRKNVAEWWFERPSIGISGYEYQHQERTLTPFMPAGSLRVDF